MKLSFGKYAGKSLAEAWDEDPDYVMWLAGYEEIVDHDERTVDYDNIADAGYNPLSPGAQLSRNAPWYRCMAAHPAEVAAARALVDAELAGRCWNCFGKLVPIGGRRANGAGHADWDARRLHKKCWKELVAKE